MTDNVRERPILFSAPLVKAILAGTKSQTRRLVNTKRLRVRLPYDVQSDIPEILPHIDKVTAPAGIWKAKIGNAGAVCVVSDSGNMLGVKPGEFDFVCPYAEGTTRLVNGKWCIEPHGSNRLWVKETFNPHYFDNGKPGYRADWDGRAADVVPVPKWTPSIFMPRWASRITLEVVSVRVERLQDISEEDAKAEGLAVITKDNGRTWKYGIADSDGLPGTDDTGWAWSEWNVDPRKAYAKLWDSINGPGTWSANHWVFALTFKRLAQEARAA